VHNPDARSFLRTLAAATALLAPAAAAAAPPVPHTAPHDVPKTHADEGEHKPPDLPGSPAATPAPPMLDGHIHRRFPPCPKGLTHLVHTPGGKTTIMRGCHKP